MTTSSRIISSLAYLSWVPAYFALMNPPDGKWCELEHVQLLFVRLYHTPVLALVFGLVCIWRSFERGHWLQAFLISLVHSVLALAIFAAGLCIGVIPMLGALIGAVLVFVVLPVWLFTGWCLQLGLGMCALAGARPFTRVCYEWDDPRV